MGRRTSLLLTTALILGFVASSPALPLSPTKIFSGFLSNALSLLMKSLWSIKLPTRVSSPRSKLKFESGYNVETVFDGSKQGVVPHSLVVLSTGELLILDSSNSNIHLISSALSLYSRPKLVAGSADGYSGHVDGSLRDSRMNHPKGIAVDDNGNIYVADVMNSAIRKISYTGVTTIAGGRSHTNGASRDVGFSNDFDVVYVGSSCSLLVIDRGNRAVREIQLHYDDCVYQYRGRVSLGIVVLLAAIFFGYMLSLVQLRIKATISSKKGGGEARTISPTLAEDGQNKHDGIIISLGNLLAGTFASLTSIVGSMFPNFIKTATLAGRGGAENHDPVYQEQQQQHGSSWPTQDFYVIPNDEELPPPSIENRIPTPQKTYPFMAEDAVRKSRAVYSGWDPSFAPQKNRGGGVSGWGHVLDQSLKTGVGAGVGVGAVGSDKFYDTTWTEGAADRGASSVHGRHSVRPRYSTKHS